MALKKFNPVTPSTRQLVIVDQLPRTSIGKVRKDELGLGH